MDDETSLVQSFTSISTFEPVGQSFTSNASFGMVGQSFTSNSSLESFGLGYSANPLRGHEAEPAYVLNITSHEPDKEDVTANVNSFDEIPYPTKLTQTNSVLVAHETGDASVNLHVQRGRRRGRSLITLAQKAEQRQEKFIFKSREEQPSETHDPLTKKTNTRGRRKNKSLITLAQKAQISSNQCSSQEPVDTPDAQLAASIAAVRKSQPPRDLEVCNVCGGVAQAHFKFCQFCGASTSLCCEPEDI